VPKEETTVTIRVTKEGHRKLKLLAALWGVSMQEALERLAEDATKQALREEQQR
jgi:hypothetical protein